MGAGALCGGPGRRKRGVHGGAGLVVRGDGAGDGGRVGRLRRRRVWWRRVWWRGLRASAGGASAGGASAGGAASDAASSGVRPRRSGFAAAAGMFVFALAAFAYYAAYDLGYPNAWVTPVVGAVVAVAAIGRPGAAPAAGPPLAPAESPAAVSAGVAAGVPAGVGCGVGGSGRPCRGSCRGRLLVGAARRFRRRRAGGGAGGRLQRADGVRARRPVLRRPLATVIRAERPDVVLLSEVDRGWLLNGGHDTCGARPRPRDAVRVRAGGRCGLGRRDPHEPAGGVVACRADAVVRRTDRRAGARSGAAARAGRWRWCRPTCNRRPAGGRSNRLAMSPGSPSGESRRPAGDRRR